jgi:hypothetical protein
MDYLRRRVSMSGPASRRLEIMGGWSFAYLRRRRRGAASHFGQDALVPPGQGLDRYFVRQPRRAGPGRRTGPRT